MSIKEEIAKGNEQNANGAGKLKENIDKLDKDISILGDTIITNHSDFQTFKQTKIDEDLS